MGFVCCRVLFVDVTIYIYIIYICTYVGSGVVVAFTSCCVVVCDPCGSTVEALARLAWPGRQCTHDSYEVS